MYETKKQRDRKRLRRNNRQSSKEMREAVSMIEDEVDRLERLTRAEKILNRGV